MQALQARSKRDWSNERLDEDIPTKGEDLAYSQRNKHIQHVLVEAAKLAPRHCHELALIYEKEMKKFGKGDLGPRRPRR